MSTVLPLVICKVRYCTSSAPDALLCDRASALLLLSRRIYRPWFSSYPSCRHLIFMPLATRPPPIAMYATSVLINVVQLCLTFFNDSVSPMSAHPTQEVTAYPPALPSTCMGTYNPTKPVSSGCASASKRSHGCVIDKIWLQIYIILSCSFLVTTTS